MFPETGSATPTYSNVTELCQLFGLPGPERMNHQIIGSLDCEGDQIRLDREELSSVIQNAAALVPAVYTWIFQ